MYADDLLLLSPSLSGMQHMMNLCSEYANVHSLVYNVKKTCCTVIGKQRLVNARIFLEQQVVTWTDRFRYLGIDFNCNDTIEVDVAPVRKNFYAACNNLIAKSRGVMEPVAVQLVKSYCLPLLVYCVGALRLTRSAVRQLSVCWNDAFRKIFHFKRFESVRTLQIEFGSVDFQHMYDLHRWAFLKSVGGKCKYWSHFVNILYIQFHICDDLFDKYVVKTGFNRSFKACVYQHCSCM